MIRTNVVKLSSVPAVAYRQKLPAGGSGIVIVRSDSPQPGIASLSKTSGKAIPTENTDTKLFPDSAFEEAIELTQGMPYRKLGSVKYTGEKITETADESFEGTPEEAAEVVVDSKDYMAVIDQYTDRNGKLSYKLLNKDMIQFAHRSSTVRRMVSDGCSEEKIRSYVVATKMHGITGNRDLTEGQVARITEMLDEVSPRGVFTELNAEIRSMLSAAGK